MTSPQQREQEIRERVENVSSAPWLPSPEKGGLYPDEIHGGENGEYRIARFYSNPRRDLPFVIAARTDIPYLLARLAQLTQALEFYADQGGGYDYSLYPETSDCGIFVGEVIEDAGAVACQALATMPLGV